MKILLIEDDARLGPLIARLLTAERHTVQLSATGADGIDFWESASWDLVILDRMLPDLEGSSILRDRRHAGDTTPVLMLTALGTVDDRVEGLDSGADDYLTKPFAATELLARVRALGRRGEMSASGEAEREVVPGLLLDEGRHALTAGEKVIDLSAREKHGAKLDCELLALVYLELIGGREPGLALSGLEASGGSSAGAGKAIERPYRAPRAHAPSAEEIAAHAAFVGKLNDPVWAKIAAAK